MRLAVPAGFEVTSVDAVQLARWEAKRDGRGKQTLEATLREPTSEQIVLRITANRSPDAASNWLKNLEDWSFPKLEPLDTAGQCRGHRPGGRRSAAAGEHRRPTGLLPIDVGALSGAIPASVLEAEPGAPLVRQVAALLRTGRTTTT